MYDSSDYDSEELSRLAKLKKGYPDRIKYTYYNTIGFIGKDNPDFEEFILYIWPGVIKDDPLAYFAHTLGDYLKNSR